MIKAKRSFAIMALLTVILASVCLSVFICADANVAHAETLSESQEVEGRGIYTKVTLSIGVEYGGNTVWAEAHNDVTLGFSKVEVIVKLYSSLSWRDTCDTMTLESMNHIDDLDIHKSITTTAEINGVQRYWRARVEYRLDDKAWKYDETSIRLVSADGMFV